MEIVIITGLSGAGKTKASDWFEDNGYYCIDNMPLSLISNFVELAVIGKKKIKKAAFVIDSRGENFFSELEKSLKELKEKEEISLKILYVDSSTEVLIRRYSETRREHPLSKGGLTTKDAILKEQKLLSKLKENADYVIDTSTFKLSDFNRELEKIFLTKEEQDSFNLKFQSFGYKNGVPLESDWIIDVRFIPNPYYVPGLKNLTGRNKKIKDYVLKQGITLSFLEEIVPLIESLIEGYKKEGKYSLTISIGCTGGHHRSVVIASELKRIFLEKGHTATLEHRDL